MPFPLRSMILFLSFSSVLGTVSRQKYDKFALDADLEDVTQAESSSAPNVTRNLQASLNDSPEGIGDPCINGTRASQEETERRYQKEANGNPEPKGLCPIFSFHVEGRDDGPDALLVVVQVRIDPPNTVAIGVFVDGDFACSAFIWTGFPISSRSMFLSPSCPFRSVLLSV